MVDLFSTKAGTLASIKNKLQSARIPALYTFSIEDWETARSVCLDTCHRILGSGPWIVRSSCANEDASTQSNAGKFLSILNVTTENLESAINNVISSYGGVSKLDEVLIQPQLKNVLRSGVVFSHDPNTSSPYRIINWSEGADTQLVTSGHGGKVWRQAANSPVLPEIFLQPIIRLLDELEVIFGGAPLDFEFAVTRELGGEVLWLLQVRPLILKALPESAKEQEMRLDIIHRKITRGIAAHPFLIGQRTMYGVMPDWNPAEIVGIKPRPLALSLYRELVTDSIWAYQRHNYGYRNLRSFPLMPHFFGLPYIDVRLSFNSFIPADLDDDLAGRLVDYYMNLLLEKPSLHDKVEFEIVFSCYTLDLPKRMERLVEAGFSKSECLQIADSLRRLSNRIVHPENGLWRDDALKLDILQDRRKNLLDSCADPLERIYWLLEDGKRYGTLPFAGLARAGFVSVQMLKSMVAVGIFSKSDYDAFIASVSTVSGQLGRDKANLSQSDFLSRYGHLRPGTYDILSPRYDEQPHLYFNWSKRPELSEKNPPFSLTLPQMRELVKMLRHHGLEHDPVGLFDFMQAGIELRELAKFHFTRNLSDVLALIGAYGQEQGFNLDDLSYCDISAFKELYVAAVNPKDILSSSIEQGRARYEQSLKISLPPLITCPDDVWAFELPEASPNFITQKAVTAHVARYSEGEALTGAIICIPNADPGFDWLFSYPIAGLITTWGGANSHMAIRAGELGLPAIIGAGDILYTRWSAAKKLHLDCGVQRVDVLA